MVGFIKEMIPYYLERMKKSGENVMVNTSLERFKIMIAYLYIFYFPCEQRLQNIVRKLSDYIVTTK